MTAWPHGKAAAVSLTFDDGIKSQFTTALPLLNRFGIRSTFFVTTDFVRGYWDLVRKADADGHEIASHTLSHPNFITLTDSLQVEKEIRGARDTIEAMIPGKRCLTMAWPYGNKSPLSKRIASRYFLSARTCGGRLEDAQPSDWFDVRGVSFDSGVSVDLVESEVEKARLKGKWIVEIIHGIDGVGYKPITVANLERHFAFLKSRQDELWLAPYVDVVKYAAERKTSVLGEVSSEDSAKVFSLTDGMPDSVYDMPLTVKVELPMSWAGAKAVQNGKELPISLSRGAATLFAYVDAVPDRGEIRVSKVGDFAGKDHPPFLTIVPWGGIFPGPVDVSVSANIEGRFQYAILDSGRDTSWNDWTPGTKIDKSCRLGFRAVTEGDEAVDPIWGRFLIDAAPSKVSADLQSGKYDSGKTVILESSRLADIYFTLDGSEPISTSNVFSYPILLSRSVRLKAMAVDMFGNRSPVESREYIINGKPLPEEHFVTRQAIPPQSGRIVPGQASWIDVMGRARRFSGNSFLMVRPSAGVPGRTFKEGSIGPFNAALEGGSVRERGLQRCGEHAEAEADHGDQP